MSTYVIGDIQGCYDELMKLLQKIHFDEGTDQLCFIGDLVNRGPKSLETLRFIKGLDNAVVLLGNHDLHLLAIEAGAIDHRESDTLQKVINASDYHELCEWLRQQKLLHHDQTSGYTMVHAGIAPQWDIEKAFQLAKELEEVLQGKNHKEFFTHMYGNTPNYWNDNLTGWDRLRTITNYFTRIRFCDEQGKLHFETKGPVGTQPPEFMPWYEVPNRKNKELKIIIGHWAALGENISDPNIINVDTGCVWGNCLTAMRLEDREKFTVNC